MIPPSGGFGRAQPSQTRADATSLGRALKTLRQPCLVGEARRGEAPPKAPFRCGATSPRRIGTGDPALSGGGFFEREAVLAFQMRLRSSPPCPSLPLGERWSWVSRCLRWRMRREDVLENPTPEKVPPLLLLDGGGQDRYRMVTQAERCANLRPHRDSALPLLSYAAPERADLRGPAARATSARAT